MIKLNSKTINYSYFPDKTFLIKENVESLLEKKEQVIITWLFENNEELVVLCFLTMHLRSKGIDEIYLKLPFIPNSRQDRVKNTEDVFTLKYFANMINYLSFKKVFVLDPHSHVSEALIDRIQVQSPKKYIDRVINRISESQQENLILFFPDEGAMKRYSTMYELPYVFGIKKRDWMTGEINGLSLAGETQLLSNANVLIVDDICSRGGTFYFSAKELKKAGAKEINLYISHCEDVVLEGKLLQEEWIEKIYTTNSIFTKKHERIEVFEYE
ncbi:MAG: hypothetical protein AB9836_03100 [Aminipila sp.]